MEFIFPVSESSGLPTNNTRAKNQGWVFYSLVNSRSQKQVLKIKEQVAVFMKSTSLINRLFWIIK